MRTTGFTTDLVAYNFNLGTHEPPRRRVTGALYQVYDRESHISPHFMHELAREGDTLSAELVIMAGGRADIADEHGVLPLHEAVLYGRREMVSFLLRQDGVDVNAAIVPFSHTALYLAVREGHIAIVRDLLRHGADITTEDGLTGHGLLHLAALRDDIDMIGVLVTAGANVFHEDFKGLTARDYAARRNHRAIETALLKLMEHHAKYHA